MKKKSAEPTIVDVAKRCGFSIATVSRVLNEPTKVRASTVALVTEAMNALKYPHPPTRVDEQSELVIAVLPNLDNPFYAKIIRGMQASAKSHGLEILLYPEDNPDGHARKLCTMLKMTQARGVILLSPVACEQVLDDINAIAPVVQCAEYNERSPLPYASVDDFEAAKTATELLISRGRQRIALINGPEKYKYSRQRRRGYEAALQAAGLPLETSLISHVTEMGFDSAYAVARQLLLQSVPPDGVLAASDMFAAAVVKIANAEGIRIPEELALVSFDNTYISKMMYPGVTAVNMPQFQLGYIACEVLAEHLRNPASAENKQFLLNTELVIRESV